MSGRDDVDPPWSPVDQKRTENLVVMTMAQAALGLVSPAFSAIAVDVRRDGMTIHIAAVPSESARREHHEELAEDMVGDLDALLTDDQTPDSWSIAFLVHYGAADDTWPGVECRRIFELER